MTKVRSSRSRKLKRKSHIVQDTQDSPHVEEDLLIVNSKTKLPLILKRKRLKRYKKQKCAFVQNGKACINWAVGKGTLCKQHGGDPVIKENLLDKMQEKYLDNPHSKFDPATHYIDFINLSRHGASEIELAAEFQVSIETLKGWAERYESFNTAWEVGKAMQEAWWLREGKNNLNQRSFNTPLYKFLTMNKLGYSDKIEQKNTNMNVHGVLVIPDKVSVDEWEKDEQDEGDIIDVG